MGNRSHPVGKKQSGGFTLIEVMVVVGIIIILAAILLPALGSAKRNARKTAGTVQVQGIATAIDTFATEFRSLPGPIPVSSFGSGSNIETGFSDTQNLFVALSRRYYVTTGSNPDTVPGGITTQLIPSTNPNIRVSMDPGVKPVDRAPYGGATDKPYDAYVSPKPDETTPKVTGTPLEHFPAYVDNKIASEGLPILYFRALRKYDPTVTGIQRVAVNSTAGAPATFTTASNAVLGQFGHGKTYDSQAESEYLPFHDSGLDTFLGNVTNAGPLHKALFNETGTNIYAQKGAYVLISPGLDRIYGNDSSGKTDDIIISGGL